MPFITLLLVPSNPKLVELTVHNQCLNFVENCDFSQLKNRPVSAPKMPKEAF